VARRALAADWSGAVHGVRHHLWLAEATESGRLTRLEACVDRSSLTEHLTLQRDVVAVGLDFAFSFPGWFLDELDARSGPELWALVAERGEKWLSGCEPPFWGRPGRCRPALGRQAWRRTELALPRVNGIGPKSVFQIGGAGAVGTGSIRGMPVLHRLHQAGARIWPFVDSPGEPLVIEIYPRLLTGAVRKRSAAERQKLLAERYAKLDPEHVTLAVSSEDAFDAAVSALVMIDHVDDLSALPDESDPELRLEGRIWHPGWRLDEP
jgi:hypothetical protein